METKTSNYLNIKKQRLLKKRQSLLDDFTKAACAGKQKRISELFIKIQQTNGFLKSLDLIEADTKGPKQIEGSRRYAVSSLFLHESFRKLTADQDEEFFF